MSTDSGIGLLKSLGAQEIAHPGHGGTMLTHLLRVQALLREWGEPEVTCTAGLLHGLFGPAPLPDGGFYTILPLDERRRAVEAVGAEAADLVYFYGACDREYTYARLMESEGQYRDRFTGDVLTPERELLRRFMAITAANEVDQALESAEFIAEHGAYYAEVFRRARPLLSEGAWRACRAAFSAVR
ncbi:hypothetical protein AV521_43850 [Streptomyces sp. IMTB 2501]|uniref:DUF6817 domain-containing protein n=1 Tax=Streptomyces sp. IMTB 2501 TaxID=1776340 RepID=UPI00096F6B11|nr:hypothetical protein [Streptomyces sp. IMTB 2501]OLZ61269.1 hypothetical protein AV521_43850 [Streptomyces sp. IMTB 2501]